MASNVTTMRFVPNLGWWDGPEAERPPGSTQSVRNWIVQDGRLEIRPHFEWLGQSVGQAGALGAAPVGVAQYVSSQGTYSPVVFSASTVMYFHTSAWTTLVGGGPGAASFPDAVHGTSIYLPRTNTNAFVFASQATAPALWPGQDSGTRTASTITSAPYGPADLVTFDRRVLCWNVRATSSATRYPTRLQWCAYNDAEDWTGPSSGFLDLTEIQGTGTRCFVWGNEVVLATNREIWRLVPDGRSWHAEVITRNIGMPYPFMAAATEFGIVWVGADFMVYRYAGGQPEPIGQAIQRTLRIEIDDTARYNGGIAYDPVAQQLWLIFRASGVFTAIIAAFTYSVPNKAWTRQYVGQPGVSFSARPFWYHVGNALAVVTSDGTTIYQTPPGNAGLIDRGSDTVQGSAAIDLPHTFADTPLVHRFLDEVQLSVQHNQIQTSAITLTMYSDVSANGALTSRTTSFLLNNSVATSNDSLVRWTMAPLTGRHFTFRVDVSGLSQSGVTTTPNIALTNIVFAGRYTSRGM